MKILLLFIVFLGFLNADSYYYKGKLIEFKQVPLLSTHAVDEQMKMSYVD